MDNWTPVTWKKGKRKIDGFYKYIGSDRFTVELNSYDRITGQKRVFSIYGDRPEWNGWKLETGKSTISGSPGCGKEKEVI